MKLKLTIIVAFVALIALCVGSYILLNLSVSPLERCKSLLEEAATAEQKHDTAAARRCYSDAIEQAKTARNYELMLKAARSLAAIDVADNKIDDAVATLQKALAAEQANTNNRSPDEDSIHMLGQKAMGLKDLSKLLEQVKKYSEAEKACLQALAIASEPHGPTDMTENLMIDHERILQEMGRTTEAHEATMARNTTFQDFRDCYNAGVDACIRTDRNLDEALTNLQTACAIARRTHPDGRFSALTFLALVYLYFGQTKDADNALIEAEPLMLADKFPDDRTRFFAAKAFCAGANGNDAQAQKWVSMTCKSKSKTPRETLQQIAWATNSRHQNRNIAHALAVICLASVKDLGSDPSALAVLLLTAANVNLDSGSAADFKTLIGASLKADRVRTRKKYSDFLMQSYAHDCANGDLLVSTADELKLAEPENLERDLCQQILIWQGRISLSKGRFRDADKYFSRALSTLKRYPQPDPNQSKEYYSASQEGLANVARAEGKTTDAMRSMTDALNATAISKNGSLNGDYIWRSLATIDLLIQSQKYQESRQRINATIAAVKPFRSSKEFTEQMDAELERRLGDSYLRDNKQSEAVEHLSIARAKFQTSLAGMPDKNNIAACDASLANAHAQ